MHYKVITIKSHNVADEGMGNLSVFESSRDIPFDIKRFYYISNAKAGVIRGHHAHKTLWQLLFCPFGSINIEMNNGEDSESVLLDSPSKALLVGPGVWHTMDWIKDDSVLCVAASGFYDESDYMRDYQEFLAYMQEHPELR